MVRPCFLVVDREFAGSISTRKLVIETAKLNVLTAYSGTEALATLARYPAVDGVVMDGGIEDIPCVDLVRRIKEMQPDLPVIVVAGPDLGSCPQADFELESFEPAKLLDVIKSLIPASSLEIELQNERLSREQRQKKKS